MNATFAAEESALTTKFLSASKATTTDEKRTILNLAGQGYVTVKGKPAKIEKKKPSWMVRVTTKGGYDTNPASSATNPRSDRSANLSPSVEYTLPLDLTSTLKVDGTLSATRYDEFPGLGGDTLSASATYSKTASVRYLDEDKKSEGTATREMWLISASTRTNYEIGLDDWKATFTTLSGRWFVGNEPLSGLLCKASKGPAYCHYVNYGVTIGQTWSDAEVRNNASAVFDVTLGVRPPINEKMIVTVGGSIGGAVYTADSIDRNDATLALSTGFTWPLSDVATFVGDAKYTARDSSLATAEYENLSALLSIKVDLNPCPDDKKK